MKLLLTLIGLLLIFEGLPYAAFPEAAKEWLKQVASLDSKVLRGFGIIAVLLGLLICFVTQRTGFLG